MKAYYVYLDYGCDRWSVVVFAESAGQAKMEAIRSGYLGDYVEYLTLKAKRVPKLDDKYRGHEVMEFELDMQDRIDLYELMCTDANPNTWKNGYATNAH